MGHKHFSVSTGSVTSGTSYFQICMPPALTPLPSQLPNWVQLGKVTGGKVMMLVAGVGKRRS